MNKTLTIVIVVLVVLAAVVYFMTGEDTMTDTMESDGTAQTAQEQQDQAAGNNNTNTNTNSNTAPTNRVVLAAAETGMSATVDTALLSQPGYIVIYRVNSQNETQVIGSTDLLAAGSYSDVSIALDSAIAKDQTIVAVLHADDGDGEFEFPGSDGYLSDSNQAVYSDVDIVDVDVADESVELNENVAEYLEENEGGVEAN